MDNILQKKFETKEIGSDKIHREILPIVDVSGDFYEVRGKDAIIANIKNLLTTPLGTYPFDPEYGSLLYKQLFENCDDATEKQIYYEVSDRITQYIDGVTVDSVEIEWKTKSKECYVKVYIYIENDYNRTPLSLFMTNYGQSMYDSIDDPVYGDYTF
jgi:phage baseplate assembly protein W